MYCPRKLFLEKIKGYVEIPKDILVKGAVKHRVFDELANTEESVVCSVEQGFDWKRILALYQDSFSQILRRAVLRSTKQIKIAGLNPVSVFNNFLPFLNKEAEMRAGYVFEFMQKNKVYGRELWGSLVPKIKSEYKVSSELLDLTGKIDRVEVYPGRLVPIELKTGNPPREGAWENHKVQLAAYALLLEKVFGITVSEGLVHYIDAGQKVSVSINPFLRDKVKELLVKVRHLLKAGVLPPIVDNERKCAVCGLRNRCHSLVTEEKQKI